MKIAVIIPSYAPHVDFLPACLASICAQTRQPDCVVIVCSSATADVEQKVRAAVADLGGTQFSVRLLFRSEAQAAGKNRNDGIDLLGGDADVISFFDSDDIMHPQRLECAEAAFAAGAEVFTHPFLSLSRYDGNPVHPTYSLEDILHEPYYSIKHEYIVTRNSPDTPVRIARSVVFDPVEHLEICTTNGHCSILAELCKEIRFDAEQTGYEDSLFMAECVRRELRIIASKKPLSFYVK